MSDQPIYSTNSPTWDKQTTSNKEQLAFPSTTQMPMEENKKYVMAIGHNGG
jgi:hypothetical protein